MEPDWEKTLAAVAAGALSLDEIAAWLRSRPGVQSVQLAPYLLKSNPPQREFIVQCQSGEGSTVNQIVTVLQLGERSFRYHGLRAQP
jgi:hypothetical protein